MGNFFQYGNPKFDGKHEDDCYIRSLIIATKTDYEYVRSLYENKQNELHADLPNRPQVVDAVLADL